MDLISWKSSLAYGIAGWSTTPYTWLVGILDTADIGPLLEKPESIEAFEYFSEHCIAAHTVSASSRPSSAYADYIGFTFGSVLRPYRGRSIAETAGEVRIIPGKITFQGAAPSAVNSFYQSVYTLLNTTRVMPIVWGSNFMTGVIVQEFLQPTLVKDVVYATWNTSATTQRPSWVRIRYRDTNGVWQNGVDVQVGNANVLNLKTGTLNVMATAVSLQMLTALAGQTGWAIDTFYCTTTSVESFIPETAQSVIMCPIMYGAANYPATLNWTQTRTPVFQFDMSEVHLNRIQTDILPMICMTDRMDIGASV